MGWGNGRTPSHFLLQKRGQATSNLTSLTWRSPSSWCFNLLHSSVSRPHFTSETSSFSFTLLSSSSICNKKVITFFFLSLSYCIWYIIKFSILNIAFLVFWLVCSTWVISSYSKSPCMEMHCTNCCRLKKDPKYPSIQDLMKFNKIIIP